MLSKSGVVAKKQFKYLFLKMLQGIDMFFSLFASTLIPMSIAAMQTTMEIGRK